MQPESAKYEEEMPSLFWALDPVFSTFARLYIKDIKEMRESKQVPGMYTCPITAISREEIGLISVAVERFGH